MTPIIQALWAAEAAEDLIRDTVTGSQDDLQETITVTLPAYQTNDTVVLCLRLASASSDIVTPAGWVERSQRSSSGNSAVLTRVMEAGDGATVTIEHVGSDRRAAWTAYAIVGARAVEAAQASSPPALTPAGGEMETLWITFASMRTSNNGVDAVPEHYGELLMASNGFDSSTAYCRAASAHRVHAADSETPGAWVFSGTTDSVHYHTVSVRPQP